MRRQVLDLFNDAAVPYEEWAAVQIREQLPFLSTGSFYPPKSVTDPRFWADPDGEVSGYWNPDAGFIDDPQMAARNLMDAASRHGAHFRLRSLVTAIDRRGGRVDKVTLADGSRLSAPVVVNVAGPHSATINALAGVGDDFTVTTRPMRQEVHHVPAPSRRALGS